MEIESTIQITEPPSKVYAFLIDSENLPLWINNHVRAKPIKGEPGEKDSLSKHYFSRKELMIETTLEITESIPEHKIQGKLIHDGFEIDLCITLEPLEDGTNVHLNLDYNPRALVYKLFFGFNKKKIAKSQYQNLVRLKDSVEALSESEWEEDN